MKKIKRIVKFLFVLSLLSALFVGVNALHNQDDYDYNAEYLSVLEENSDCYYLQRTSRNIKFSVAVSDSLTVPDYSVVDSNGDMVSTGLDKVTDSNYDICSPTGGYIVGEQYTLTLSEGLSLTDENLQRARTLIFSIERSAVAKYDFTDRVIETTEPIKEFTDDIISFNGATAKPGEIVFGANDNGEYVAYKISEIRDDGTASVTVPAIDEIYSELDVYGDYDFDVDDLIANENLEIEIAENTKNSNFYSALIMEAYALGKTDKGAVDVSITRDSNTNSLDTKIKITLKPGQDGLFGMCELKDHEVSITYNSSLNLKVQSDIRGVSKWDVAASVKSGSSLNVKITRILREAKTEAEIDDLFSPSGEIPNVTDYQQYVKNITNKLNKIAEDASGGELKIFDWKMPIPSVPGLYYSAEVKLFIDLEMTASIDVGADCMTFYRVGVCFANNEFNTYSNLYSDGVKLSLSVRGEAESKTGIKLEVGATLINDKVANIRIDPEAGVYMDMYATVPIYGELDNISKRCLYGYFEPGIYLGADLNARLNIVLKTVNYSYGLAEKKLPFDNCIIGENEIALDIESTEGSIAAVNNVAKLPNILFEYYDVKDNCINNTNLSNDDLEYTLNDGTALEVYDGNVVLPSGTPSGSNYVTAKYHHSNGGEYDTTFEVVVYDGIVINDELNRFFSNFCDPWPTIDEFSAANIDMDQLIEFSIFYNLFNNSDQCEEIQNYYGGYYSISEEYVEQSIRRFFDLNSEEHIKFVDSIYAYSTVDSGIGYENGYFNFLWPDNEIFNFAHVTKLYDNGDGTYTVLFDVYGAYGYDLATGKTIDYSKINVYANKSEWDYKIGDSNYFCDCHYEADVKPYYYNGIETYQVISMKKK